MQAARALLEGIVDYAGLFPPAKLDMAPTVRNYDALRKGKDVWLLGRIIIPVARLAEFETAGDAILPRVQRDDGDDAWPMSALTAPAGDPQFAKDIALIEAFNDTHATVGGTNALIDVIETKASSAAEIDAALDVVPPELFPYFELPVEPDPRGLIAALASLDAGAKIRTGGLTADAHPTAAQVARFIEACGRAEVPFKATAGLHHALRNSLHHGASDVGYDQHGFLNVFFGAALLWHERIEAADLARLLEVRSLEPLRFADDGASWEDARLTLAEIRSARDAFAHAFGSCSFDEPLADLRELRLIQPETAAR